MRTPRWFQTKNPITLLLWPVSLIYYTFSRIVHLFRSIGPVYSKRPIICIGNILAGGVGKTPIVREIATRLDAPVVMRGYKKTSQTGDIGDEAKMLAAAGLQVHVGNRKSNIKLLSAQKSNTPIVMDDGFQNPGIKKDISVLVFDGVIGLGNGFMLPAGPLREPASAINRADAIVIIKRKTQSAKRKEIDFSKYGKSIFYATTNTINPYPGEKIFAFAGIGYPKKFFGALGNIVGTKSFADHYQYTRADLDRLFARAARKNARLVTTEKDWVRLPADVREKIKFAKMETVIDTEFFEWLGDKIKCKP